jgi:hypothetical protein
MADDSCAAFYEKHLKEAGYKIVDLKTYPTLGLEYSSAEGYIGISL